MPPDSRVSVGAGAPLEELELLDELELEDELLDELELEDELLDELELEDELLDELEALELLPPMPLPPLLLEEEPAPPEELDDELLVTPGHRQLPETRSHESPAFEQSVSSMVQSVEELQTWRLRAQ